jgi:hypothetical protein
LSGNTTHKSLCSFTQWATQAHLCQMPGEKVRVQRQKVVRSWFFERDGGVYVQCKYGAKALPLSKDGNAVFVKQLADVPAALQAIYAAAAAGEFDAAITSCVKR